MVKTKNMLENAENVKINNCPKIRAIGHKNDFLFQRPKHPS